MNRPKRTMPCFRDPTPCAEPLHSRLVRRITDEGASGNGYVHAGQNATAVL